MKKLKLKALELGARELLSREQLRTILGGDGSDEGGSTPCSNSPTTACIGKAVGSRCCWQIDREVNIGRCLPVGALSCIDA
ncbi:hypothetical protein CLV59_108139 [Chitinophaga dinghuensis]|uniref:Natural product n=1 Tax=Chitinophaga dinghuensis TaxID=1539050 RepID=A0A327VRE6_9BACT|nr:hypothetical protein CLV59_108139 [Chitinophaga dinghuensis]